MADYFGNDRDNRFNGDSGNNIAQGKGGDDRLSGNAGSDELAGGTGADILKGGADNDAIYSFEFAWIPGDEDQDRPILDGGAERDTLSGGNGDDGLYAGYGDTVDGGAGFDYAYLSFGGADTGIDADFSILTGGGTLSIGGATLSGIEAILWIDGSEFDDTFTLSPDASEDDTYYDTTIYGFGGNDHITHGYHGGDVYGGDGDDIIDDRNLGYDGNVFGERLNGDAGDDMIYVGVSEYSSIIRAYGGTGQDILLGNAGNDTLDGGDDDDILDGSTGADTLTGDAGTDRLFGGESNDVLDGGTGTDTLYGDSGYIASGQGGDFHDDYLFGGEGADTIYGEAGSDRLYADTRPDGLGFDTGIDRDVLSGGDGDDTISAGFNDDADGGDGTDTLILSFMTSTQGVTLRTSDLLATGFPAGAGNISGFERLGNLRGSEFADDIVADISVDGGGGDDRLTAAFAGIALYGGAGDDLLVSARGENNLSGGDGIDTVTYARFGVGVKVYLGGDLYSDGYGPDDDYLSNIENVVGTRFADTILGNDVDNSLTGGLGDDQFRGYYGDDVINGGAGTDLLQGEEGDDVLDGGSGADAMSGYVGSDTYIVDDARDTVSDYPGDEESTDTVFTSIDYVLPDYIEDLFLTGRARSGIGNNIDNRIVGTVGGDVLAGRGGNDILGGGAGRDIIDGDNGKDTLTGGAGTDRLTGGASADVFRFVTGDIGNTARTADTIIDFSHADGDKISLSAIDAVAGTARNDAFRFVGTAAFSDSAGELRYEVSHGDTLVMGDTNGDGITDLFIRLSGTVALVASDFGTADRFAVAGDAAPNLHAHAVFGGMMPAPFNAHEMLV